MKKAQEIVAVAIFVIMMVCAVSVTAQEAPPIIPALYYGNIEINGVDAPKNTVVVAKTSIDESRIVTTEKGKFGAPHLGSKLGVEGTPGDEVNFYVASATKLIRANETVTWKSGDVKVVNLSVAGEVGPPPDKIVEVVDNGTIDARPGVPCEVIVTGSGTIAISKYEEGEVPAGGFSNSIGKYIDVYIVFDDGIDELEIRLYYTNADISGLKESSLRMWWYDGATWSECSDTGVDTANDYIWVKIRSDTTPSLSQLVGTAFGGHGSVTVTDGNGAVNGNGAGGGGGGGGAATPTPTPTATETPVTPSPTPTSAVTPSPTTTPTSTPTVPVEEKGIPYWIWVLIAAGGVVAAGAAYWLHWKKRTREKIK